MMSRYRKYMGLLGVLVVVSSWVEVTVVHGGPKKPGIKKGKSGAVKTPRSQQGSRVSQGGAKSKKRRDILGWGGVRYPLSAEFNSRSEAFEKVHRNSNSYGGRVHAYFIHRPYGKGEKVGISARGDGSKRSGSQVSAKNKLREGKRGKFRDRKLRSFPGTKYAKAYEKRFRDTYRRLYGKGIDDYKTLPGNREHLRGKKNK